MSSPLAFESQSSGCRGRQFAGRLEHSTAENQPATPRHDRVLHRALPSRGRLPILPRDSRWLQASRRRRTAHRAPETVRGRRRRRPGCRQRSRARRSRQCGRFVRDPAQLRPATAATMVGNCSAWPRPMSGLAEARMRSVSASYSAAAQNAGGTIKRERQHRAHPTEKAARGRGGINCLYSRDHSAR